MRRRPHCLRHATIQTSKLIGFRTSVVASTNMRMSSYTAPGVLLEIEAKFLLFAVLPLGARTTPTLQNCLLDQVPANAKSVMREPFVEAVASREAGVETKTCTHSQRSFRAAAAAAAAALNPPLLAVQPFSVRSRLKKPLTDMMEPCLPIKDIGHIGLIV